MTLIKHLLVLLILTATFIGCEAPKQESTIQLIELSIADIHQAFEEGSLSSEQLVSAYLAQIQAQDSSLNALTTINLAALEMARTLDQEFQSTGVLRPLHGIPMIVKDNINTAGLPTTAGALALKDFIPEEDAFIIQKLRAAGAIILAKSNMAEWAFSPMHTESSTAGTTRNPYHLDHVPAGSSGGTAAAIAANIGVIGLGTDTGNSIRGPSSHCALVGFRTTMGLVSRSAIVPLLLRNDVVGPMCRNVEDASRVLEVIAGYDPDDPLTQYSQGNIPDNYQQFLVKEGLQRSRIGVLRELIEQDPDPEVSALFEQALEDLDSLGAEVIDPIVIPNFASLAANQWCSEFRKDIEAYLATYVKRDSLQSLEEIIQVGTRSEFTATRLERYAIKEGRYDDSGLPCLDAYQDSRRIAFREAIERVMDSLQLDAIVYPSWNHQPAQIEFFEEGYQGDNSQIIAPHTGQPAFSVPMGYSSKNLPAGLQFLGRMYAEPTLIRLTYAYEQGTMHRRPPSLKLP